MKKFLHQPFFIRLFHWEYWPFHVVYGPTYFYWLWLCLKARSFFFFNTANPTIKNGGFLMESKKEIYDLIPQQFYPRTLLFSRNVKADEIKRKVVDAGLSFPLIGKPDIGMKALMVKKLQNEIELHEYAIQSKVDFLIQEYIPYPNEIGVFYYRYPNEARGNISGIVKKIFLSVTGDGCSTIEELVQKNQRALLQLKALRKMHGGKLQQVLEEGKEFILVPYGSHFRGSEFIDESHRIDKELCEVIDNVCRQVPGYYYGRLDLRFNTWEELRQGKNFSLVEINGAGSEPTHIYDPGHSIFFAWKEIIRHWKILFRISHMNHQREKMNFMSVSKGLEMFRENKSYLKLIGGK